MKTNQLTRRIFATALVVTGMATLSGSAQLFSFDNPGSFSTVATYNPPPIIARFDYGTATASATHSIAWSALDAAANPGSGSLQLSWNWNHVADGDGAAAWTIDLFNFADTATASSLSFDVRVDPTSAADLFGGYGFFEVVSRDANYAFNKIPTFNTELGNPTYGGPGTSLAGTWEHFNIPLTGVYQSVRAITFQDYNDTARNINGTVTIQIDNIMLTPVPEPSTAALLGLGLCGAMFRIARRPGK